MHEKLPLTYGREITEEEWKDGIKCSVFLYSPLMANVKFAGLPTSFYVYVSNEGNYFNHYYFGINSLMEALISSGPLIIVQLFCIQEHINDIKVIGFYI